MIQLGYTANHRIFANSAINVIIQSISAISFVTGVLTTCLPSVETSRFSSVRQREPHETQPITYYAQPEGAFWNCAIRPSVCPMAQLLRL